MKTFSKHEEVTLGIDPGKSGGLALYNGKQILLASKMPDTDTDIVELIRNYRPWITRAVMESVNPFPGQGVSSVWTFAQNYGLLRGILAAFEIPREFVRPNRWQSDLGIPKRGDKSKTEHKNVLKSRAQELFPSLPITLATADAILIATWKYR